MAITMAAMGRGSALQLRFVLLNFLTLSILSFSSATQYTVGGSTNEWTLNVDYITWAAKYSFKINDTLLFIYNPTEHNVYQVSQTDYDSCNSNNPIQVHDDGNTVVTLKEATPYYFICGIPDHCSQFSMKVPITVEAGSASSPPTTSPNISPPVKTPSGSPTSSSIPSLSSPSISPSSTMSNAAAYTKSPSLAFPNAILSFTMLSALTFIFL